MSNIDTSNIILDAEIQELCCMMNEMCSNRTTIQMQCNEIGKLIQEKNEYKTKYENLLILIGNNSSNI